jgi:hypothetical protein
MCVCVCVCVCVCGLVHAGAGSTTHQSAMRGAARDAAAALGVLLGTALGPLCATGLSERSLAGSCTSCVGGTHRLQHPPTRTHTCTSLRRCL